MTVTVTVHHKKSKGLDPAGQDSKGLYFTKASVSAQIVDDINNGNHIQRRSKNVTEDLKKATDTCNEATKMFEAALDRMITGENKITDASKRTSGSVRKAANELHEGMQRIEKVANFDRLERYVGVLERAAAALKTLAELEQGGKLARIAEAVKV